MITTKKLLFLTMALFCLLACSSELDNVKSEIKDLEEQARKLQQQKDSIENASKKQQDENYRTQNQIDEAAFELDRAFLKSMEFLPVDNPLQIFEETKCEIIGDSVIECWVPNIMTDKILIPRFEFNGVEVSIDGRKAESGVTIIDFRKPTPLTVASNNQKKNYTIYVHSFTGIPMLWIETAGLSEIASNRQYKANLRLMESVKTRAAGDVIEEEIKIKGDGVMSWIPSRLSDKQQMGKNPYIIYFNNPISVFDEPLNNDWELLPNDIDNTMLRTQTAFYMGKLSNLHFTPRFHFVEFMLNGRYYGTYMLGDCIEYSTFRVDVGVTGYILKIGPTSSSSSFTTNNIEQQIYVAFPTVVSGDDEYTYIRDYLHSAENALFGSDFTDANEGWKKYLDMDSFVDWYLINEIIKNEDAAFKSECYMNMKKNEKLRMGPLWKSEKSFGYDNSSINGFVVKNTKWYNRLFQDPAFVSKVKERFAFFYNHKNDIIKEINANAEYLKYAVQENDNKWGVFNSGVSVTTQYKNTISSMKDWLEKRMDWLNGEISNM